MTFSCEVNSQKAAKYAIAASKSFSYYLPKSAQRHLQELLKQLPSAARPIYDEYYRDLKCAKARAPESAIAMTTFIASSLPKIAKKHNAFAREMNKEVVSHEHEGYEPIKFPIVAEPEIDDEATTVANTGKKRKRAPAGSIPLLNRPDKKAKKKPSATLVTIPSSVTTPPLSSPGQINPDDPEPEGSIASTPVPRDVQRTTPGSIRFAGNERSRDSSPLPDVPPSAQLNNEEEPFGQPSVQSNTDKQSLLRDDVSVTPIEEHDGEATSLPLPSTVMPESRDDDPSAVTDEFVADLAKNLEGPLEDSASSDPLTESDYALRSEEERWEDGMQALEDFDWDCKSSQ
ncbi:hypothetical protein N0V86_006079 [Didymella sp. IMI 355093]|nr:hypothetical protein N0V86_006079 [Didymella sp. IMI 355093]